MSSANSIPETTELEQETLQFRSQMGHISRHSIVFFGGTVFTAVAGYLFKVYLARKLGAETLGMYALGMTINSLFGIFGALGLPQSAVRFVAAFRAKQDYEGLRSLIWKGTGILLLLNLTLAAAVAFLGPWIARTFYRTPALVPYMGMFAVILVMGAMTGFWGQILVGYRDVSSRAIITNFIGSTLLIVVTAGMFTAGIGGLRGYLLAQIVSSMIILTLLWRVARRHTPAEARVLSSRFRPLPREVLHFSATVFGLDSLKFLLSQSDKVLIGMYLTARAVGVYSVAAAIVVYVAIILQSVNQIFSPTIASLHARGEHQLLGRIFQTLTKWVIGLTIPLAGVVIVFARPIMRVFGTGFESGWPVLVLGTVGQLVSCGVGSVGFLLLMSGNQKRLLRVQMTMAVVMVGLNLALIPVWGIIGASIAAAVTNAGANLLNLRQVKSVLGLSPYNRSYLRMLLPLAVTVCFLIATRAATAAIEPQWIVIVGATLVAYLCFVGGNLIVGLNDDDRLILDAIRGRVRGTFQKAMGN